MTREEYFKEIRSLVDDIEKEKPEDLYDYVHELIDGHEYIIYTYKAQLVLAYSEHYNYYTENFGTDGVVDRSGNVDWEGLAFFAMQADVKEEIARRGIETT